MLASRLKALGLLFFMLAWLAYDHYRPWLSFHSEALALFGVGLMAVGQCVKRGAHKFSEAPGLVYIILAAALIPWAQYFIGRQVFAGEALVHSLYFFALTTAIWLAFNEATNQTDNLLNLSQIFVVLWLAALASAAIGLVQWLDLQEALGMYVVQTDIGDRAMGNLGQPNQLATLLLMGIASLAWTFERKSIGRCGLIVGVVFLTFALALTRSRAGLVSVLVVAAFLLWKNRSITTRLTPKYIWGWVLVYGVCVYLTPVAQDFLMLGGSRSMNVVADSTRPIMWRQIAIGIWQSPWFGYGWNQTPAAQAAGSVAVVGELAVSHAHNAVLDLLAWNGIPLGLLLTGLCAWWFVSRAWHVVQPVAIYAVAVVIPLLVHSLVEYPFAYAYFLLAAGLMIGIVEAFHKHQKTLAFNLHWMRASLAVWFVVGGYMVYEYLLIEEDFRVVRFENLRTGQTPADYVVPNVWMLSHLGALLDAFRQKAAPGMTPEQIDNLRRVTARFTYTPLALRYAIALGLNGEPERASYQFAVIRGKYGAAHYKAAVKVLRDLQQEKYPQLSLVATP